MHFATIFVDHWMAMAIIKTNIILIKIISDIHAGVNVTYVPLSSHEIKHWRIIDCRIDSPKVIEQIGSINRRLQVQNLSPLLMQGLRHQL